MLGVVTICPDSLSFPVVSVRENNFSGKLVFCVRPFKYILRKYTIPLQITPKFEVDILQHGSLECSWFGKTALLMYNY